MEDKRLTEVAGVFNGKNINRLEVIDKNGRSYMNLDIRGVELLVQNAQKTLKILVKEN